mmetsp:Transcript_59942/g.111113  ORF Transcript_59942/g.111113 Transcript_59942/m.111113 type:complete len:237 (-) Transcript_59942:38-748(-)
MLAPLELPVACAAAAAAILSFTWYTIGVTWIPWIGPGWDACFGVGDGVQYPRRYDPPAANAAWTTFYLLMYGILGSAAEVGSVQLSLQAAKVQGAKDSCKPTVFQLRRAKLLALFHTIIACHHIVWALTGSRHGKLELWRFDIPFAYTLAEIACCWLFWHAVKLLRANQSTSLVEIRRRKTVLDTCAVATFMQVLVFAPMNAMGMEVTFSFQREMWRWTFLTPVLVLAIDAVGNRG